MTSPVISTKRSAWRNLNIITLCDAMRSAPEDALLQPINRDLQGQVYKIALALRVGRVLSQIYK
jgi:hypothetical protein